MPILTVKVSGKKNQYLTMQIGSLLMDITNRILKKKHELTAIAIEYVDHDSWFVGGKLLSEVGMNSFYFDIKITDETNTKDEKAQYIKEAFEGFADDGERELGQCGTDGTADHDEKGGQIEQGAGVPPFYHVATQNGCQGQQQANKTHLSISLCDV